MTCEYVRHPDGTAGMCALACQYSLGTALGQALSNGARHTPMHGPYTCRCACLYTRGAKVCVRPALTGTCTDRALGAVARTGWKALLAEGGPNEHLAGVCSSRVGTAPSGLADARVSKSDVPRCGGRSSRWGSSGTASRPTRRLASASR